MLLKFYELLEIALTNYDVLKLCEYAYDKLPILGANVRKGFSIYHLVTPPELCGWMYRTSL